MTASMASEEDLKSPISVCMIVRNEERNITACLQSVLPFVEEVIVVDTGSTDRTVERARKLGAQVIFYPWEDHFSKARNAGIERATQPFVFVLDADERLFAESATELHAFCQRTDRGRVAGRVKIQNLTDREDTVTVSEITRIFPNVPEFRYSGRIHEQLLDDGQTPRTVSTNIVLAHHGYTAESIETFDKINRNLTLLQLEAEQGAHDPYIYYQIGKTHFVGKAYAESVEAFRMAVHLLSERGVGNPPYLPTLLSQFAYALLNLRQFSALFQVVSTGIDLFPDFTDLYFVYGLALIEQRDASKLLEIQEVFQHCLKLGEPDPNRYETVLGVGSFRARYNLGVVYEVLGDHENASQQYRIAAESGFSQAAERLRLLQPREV